MSRNYVPINALFDASGVRPNLSADPRVAPHEAEVIFGIDIMSGNEFLLYGKDTLQAIVKSGEARQVKFLAIGLDQETDELEKACALMKSSRVAVIMSN